MMMDGNDDNDDDDDDDRLQSFFRHLTWTVERTVRTSS